VNSHTINLEAASDGNGKTATSVSSSDSSHIASMDGNGGDAAHLHGAVTEHLTTINTVGAAVAHDESSSVRGEPPGHANGQPQWGNANPDNNGLGHQSHELPSQAATDIPLVVAVEDAKGGHAADPHGAAAAKDSSTFAESDASGVRGEPPGHGNDKARLGTDGPSGGG